MTSESRVQHSEHWIKVNIPIQSVTDLGFHPHAAEYEAEVLMYFSPLVRIRWFGSGSTIRPSDGGNVVERITWDFGVGDVPGAVEGFMTMFRQRAFPEGTTVTKVTKHPDLSFSFENLVTWSST